MSVTTSECAEIVSSACGGMIEKCWTSFPKRSRYAWLFVPGESSRAYREQNWTPSLRGWRCTTV